MYIVLTIILLLALMVIALLLVASRQPRTFHVERTILTHATAARVYTIFSDLARWREWSPYDKRDPDMAVEISTPGHGVGATFDWNGNREVGAGRLTIIDVEPDRMVQLNLKFDRPFKCENTVVWRVDEEGDQRRITWAMDGSNDTLMPRVMAMFINMDKMVGTDFEAGLAMLKAVAEQPEKAAAI